MKIMKYCAIFLFTLVGYQSTYAQNWQLVWSDEFNSGISADWVFDTGTGSGGWGNNELEYYQKENAAVVNGQLVITAKKETVGGMNYTSARMKTQGKKSWKYGKIEARIAMPSFQGVWPAFWMLGDNIGSVGWPACGEIDVMEHVNTGGTVYGTAHWSDNNNLYANYSGNTTTTVTGFHNYSIEWDSSFIRWFVDGIKYHEINILNGINGTSEFQNKFFVLLNLAIGGNWPGFTIDNNAFPAKMYVDYVRVYQNVVASQTIQAESYSAMLGVQVEATTDVGGGSDVGWIDTNDWMAYNSITIPTSGAYTIEYRVASPSGGRLSLDLNAGSTVLGAVNVPATGGWQNWTTVSQTVTINAGTYNFGIFAATGGWNLNWWRITKQAGARLSTSSEKEEVHLAEQSHFEVYPNPASTELNIIASEQAQRNIKIISANGAEVFKGSAFQGKIDITHLPTGVYCINAIENGRKVTKRFLKK